VGQIGFFRRNPLVPDPEVESLAAWRMHSVKALTRPAI
jgi:hypothetical protein